MFISSADLDREFKNHDGSSTFPLFGLKQWKVYIISTPKLSVIISSLQNTCSCSASDVVVTAKVSLSSRSNAKQRDFMCRLAKKN